jgi:HlyD family secretion protein
MNRRILQLLAGAACLLILVAGCGRSAEVQATKVRKAPITESFSEMARTRIEDRYSITMPLTARIRQIDLEPGDGVGKGQQLIDVDLVPFERAVGEARASVQELEARVALIGDSTVEQAMLESAEATANAMQEQRKSSGALIEAEQWRVRRTDREWDRLKNLPEGMAVAKTQLDDAEAAAETAVIDLRRREFDDAMANSQFLAAQFRVKEIKLQIERKKLERASVEGQLAAARERLALEEHNLTLATITSPIDGVVLEKYELGGGPLAAGQKLLLLGNLDELEVESEVLTQDAMRLRPGSVVEFTVNSRDQPISGKVRLVRPAGFVKLSSLGVEQQRVIVLCSLSNRPATLGTGFRLQGRFIVAEKSAALVVPRYSVLQSPDESYYVFRIDGRRLRRQPVTLGLRSDFDMEILSGLKEGDVVVAAPDSSMTDGARVRPTMAE